MRTCNCVGYMTNPGGVCCMDLPRNATIVTTPNTSPPPFQQPYVGRAIPAAPLTEDDIRRIVREELDRKR